MKAAIMNSLDALEKGAKGVIINKGFYNGLTLSTILSIETP